jgi:hypothetical protein
MLKTHRPDRRSSDTYRIRGAIFTKQVVNLVSGTRSSIQLQALSARDTVLIPTAGVKITANVEWVESGRSM